MTLSTPLARQQLAAYRSKHRIEDVAGFCKTDLIRILPVAGGRMRHDPDGVKRVVKAAQQDAFADRLAARLR